MKTFIFIVYVVFFFIVPQIYTSIARDINDYDSVKPIFIIFGGLICVLLIFGFTMLLIQWQVISITL